MMTQQSDAPGPYAHAHALYWDNGWHGVLPLPPRRKANPPIGWTGRQGGWPSRADITTWASSIEGDGNIGIRLPRNVIGLDVDNYNGKTGGDTIDKAVERYGPLPSTWRSTSRDDGISGIRLYRIPEALAWPGELGPNTEIIQHIHRYVVAWPSIHPEGRVYRWITPDGATSVNTIPTVDDLPELPAAWVQGITGGQAETDVPKADLDDMEAVAWLITYGAGHICELMSMEIDRFICTRFSDHASRHEAARDATARLAMLAAEGHRGAYTAIDHIRTAFVAATEADHTRPRDPGEWKRLLTGAIRMAAVDTQGAPQSADPCDVTVLPEPDPTPEPEPEPTATHPVEPTPDAPPEPPAATVLEASAVDLSILDDTAVDVRKAVTEAKQRAIEAEANFQRIRREAKLLLDHEDAVKSFRVPPSTWTLVEELEIPDEPVTYTVEDVMPAGANVLLTAQFKAGKTTLVNHLTRCLADGEKFLGKFNVSPPDGRIALFNYEVDDRQYRHWLRELNITSTPLVSVLNLRGYRLPATNGHVEDWIVKWLAERDVSVWIVDPFARAAVGSVTNENDNTEVGRFLDTLDVIKTRAGVSDLILPTHTGRAEFENGQERARGATRLDDWADVRWMLTKDDQDIRYFSATGRDVEFAEAALKFDEATRSPRVVGGSRAKESKTRFSDAVVSVVEATPGIPLGQLRVATRQIVGKFTNSDLDDEILTLSMNGRIRVEEGSKGSRRHFPLRVSTITESSE